MVRQLGSELASGAGQQHLLSRKKQHCCLCFVFGHNLLAGDIGLGSLSSFARLRQEGEDGSLLSNGGVFLLIVVMFISFYPCRSLN